MGSSGDTDVKSSSEGELKATEALDPLIVEASGEVDRGLLRWMLSLSHRARLRAATRATAALSRIRSGSA